MLKKISYKTIATCIFIISVILIIVNISIPVNEYWQSIIVSLAVNLISSVIIIYLIDIKKEKDAESELNRRKKFIYRQLISPINNYKSLLLNMYKATTSKQDFDLLILQHGSKDYLKAFKNMNNLDLNKDGFIYNPISGRHIIWKEIIIDEIFKYIDNIETFYNNHSYFLDNDLSEKLCEIVVYKKSKILASHTLSLNVQFSGAEQFIDIFNLLKIYEITNDIIKLIIPYVNQDAFKIDKGFERNDISPSFESGLREGVKNEKD